MIALSISIYSGDHSKRNSFFSQQCAYVWFWTNYTILAYKYGETLIELYGLLAKSFTTYVNKIESLIIDQKMEYNFFWWYFNQTYNSIYLSDEQCSLCSLNKIHPARCNFSKKSYHFNNRINITYKPFLLWDPFILLFCCVAKWPPRKDVFILCPTHILEPWWQQHVRVLNIDLLSAYAIHTFIFFHANHACASSHRVFRTSIK